MKAFLTDIMVLVRQSDSTSINMTYSLIGSWRCTSDKYIFFVHMIWSIDRVVTTTTFLLEVFSIFIFFVIVLIALQDSVSTVQTTPS